MSTIFTGSIYYLILNLKEISYVNLTKKNMFKEQKECFGKIYRLKNNINQGWNLKTKQLISSLCLDFNEKTKELPNGINIVRRPKSKISDKGIGMNIASFIMETYITEVIRMINDNGEQIVRLIPINIFLNSIDREYISTINKEAIESIKSIFNHPHFKDCDSKYEIEKKISDVPCFNERFKVR